MDEKYNVGLVKHLGMQLVEVTPQRVVGELEIRDELRTLGVAVHGGTLMALADTMGAMGTVASLSAGQSTSTIESKTNFFAAGRSGKVRATSIPLHKGRRTHVWETRVTDESGKLLCLTIQTQIIVDPK
jgi:1,4-dihydroxy-2-naphthoyl-CoA hydrolase